MNKDGGIAHFPPTLEFYRHRYQYGANLGGVYVLDRSLFPTMFPPSAGGSSELDAVKAAIAIYGIRRTRKIWQDHWTHALSDYDMKILATVARINTIRLPIGFYNLGPRFCKATPFEGGPAKVYKNAWRSIGRLCKRLAQWGIAVILAFYALPGGANEMTSSGTSSGKARLWTNTHYWNLSMKCFNYVAKDIRGRSFHRHRLANVIGLQICNDAMRDAPHLYKFYEHAVTTISAVIRSLPIYISDAGDLSRALKWATPRNKQHSSFNTIIVETHRKYEFYNAEGSPVIEEIFQKLPYELLETTEEPCYGISKGLVPVFVGEWSSTLSPDSWRTISADHKSEITKDFVELQRKQWQSHAVGNALWPLKVDRGDGQAVFHDIIMECLRVPETVPETVNEMEAIYNRAIAQGEIMWEEAMSKHREALHTDGKHGLMNMAHFQRGWHRGWANTLEFYTMSSQKLLPCPLTGGDWISNVDHWVRFLKRRDQGIWNLWDFENGVRAGLRDAETALGFPERV